MNKKEIFSVPNLLSCFRIVLIPVYLIVYFRAESMAGYRAAALVLVLSALTDLLDGKIARKFNMITELGKVLDPVADHLTQITVAVSLAFRYPLMRYLLILLLVKELFLAVAGAVMLKRGKKMDGAKWHGKVSTTVFSVVVVALIFVPDIPNLVSGILIGISMAFMAFSLGGYIRLYYGMAKELGAEK